MHSRFTLQRAQEGARLSGMGRAEHAAHASVHGMEVPDEMVVELVAELRALAHPG